MTAAEGGLSGCTTWHVSRSLVAAGWQDVIQGLVQLGNALEESHIKAHVAHTSSTVEGPDERTTATVVRTECTSTGKQASGESWEENSLLGTQHAVLVLLAAQVNQTANCTGQ